MQHAFASLGGLMMFCAVAHAQPAPATGDRVAIVPDVAVGVDAAKVEDRKSTRLNSSH